MTEIAIRSLHELDEMQAAVELQKLYWGSEVDSLVPAHMLFSIATYGGHVLAAFYGDRMIGVLIGLIGTNVHEGERPAMANLLIASKRMVVLPEYRNYGIGYKLKLAQRDAAMKLGIRLVTWTFDPLLAANAHLNLRKLGGVCQTYLVDYYGTSSENGLATLGTSDRLPVEWWVTHRRVEERLNGSRTHLTIAHYLEADTPIVNPADWDGTVLRPCDEIKNPGATFALVEIPLNYAAILREDEGLARSWRTHSREVFTYLMRGGYIVTDFLRDQIEGRDRTFYLMSYNMGFDFSLN